MELVHGAFQQSIVIVGHNEQKTNFKWNGKQSRGPKSWKKF